MKTPLRAWMFALRPVCAGSLSAVVLSLTGCVTRGNVEVLESHLRTQETVIRRYEQDMSRLRSELATSQKEMDLLRSNVASLGKEATLEETSRSLARVEGIVFNSLLTAGQNVDELPGDERLHAVMYPHDAHGDIVKLSGEIRLQAVDLSSGSADRSLGEWKFSPEEARDLWHAGFITSGYQFDLPWKQPPGGSKVLLVAKLTTPDGREFEATHTLTVTPGTKLSPSGPLPLNEQPVQQVKYESPAPPQRAPAANRPVPNPYGPFAPGPLREKSPPPEGGRVRIPDQKERPAPAPAPLEKQGKAEGPAAFPSGLQTSDKWTDETIPQWR